jgi:hypothetical protein
MLDTARFKYPPHWVNIKNLYESMSSIDPSTGKLRGLIVMSKKIMKRHSKRSKMCAINVDHLAIK